MVTTTKAKNRKTRSGLAAKTRNKLPAAKFAFPEERREPLNDAKHVRNAIARFDQVQGVTDAERDSAWKRIKRAAKKFDVDVSERSWNELGKPGKSVNGRSKSPSAKKKAGKAKATRSTASATHG